MNPRCGRFGLLLSIALLVLLLFFVYKELKQKKTNLKEGL